ncbi:MAG: TIGR01212 family radical SAM protein [Lachnospiraceae bacterium]|nr:TIGR01212 family radical SAM protein [Lachnospiraceae bacterium]MCI9283362.1 TIGR01212 family radical SAM protein [Lachnospiraceae bacterium]
MTFSHQFHPYHSLNDEMRRRFNTKVYKIALDGGMTCPNRDGTLGTRGCIFCSAGGSGDFATPLLPTVTSLDSPLSQAESTQFIRQQIEHATLRICRKFGASPKAYIAYFQSYTNTYAPVSYLHTLYTAVLNHPEVKVLSIATRPDCLSEEILDLCAELNHIKPVWLELGLQTIHENTALQIRRGYSLSCFQDALQRLRRRKLETIVHVILGLPGESREQMLQTVNYLAQQEIQGIKLQLLHILQGTDLAVQYLQNPFPVFSMMEYIDLVIDCIALLPPELVVHRITGDGPKNLLIAPQWSANKRLVLNTFARRFRERGLTQGVSFRPVTPL